MILINFFGAPGSGKSTAAALTYARLKKEDCRVELVRECTKAAVYGGALQGSIDSMSVLRTHETEVEILSPHCDVVVMDSPFLMTACYSDREEVKERAIKLHFGRPSYNVFMCLPISPSDYRLDGRWEDYDASKKREEAILKLEEIIDDFNVYIPFGSFSMSDALKICDDVRDSVELLYRRK